MGLFSWICLGILTGVILNQVFLIKNMVLKVFLFIISVSGAVAGGYIGIQQGWAWGDITRFNILSFAASFSACLILFIIAYAISLVARSSDQQKLL